MPYVFLVEGKVRGALYDLHGARIFPIPEALTRVLALCEKGTPLTEVKAFAGEENEAVLDNYFAQLTQMAFGRFYPDLEIYEKVGLPLSRLRFLAVDELTICPGSGPSDLALKRWLQLLETFKHQCGSIKLRLLLDGKCERQRLQDLLAAEVLAGYRVSCWSFPPPSKAKIRVGLNGLENPSNGVPYSPRSPNPDPK